jgi:hypothetical protein
MPKLTASSRGIAMTASSCSTSTVEKNGRLWVELAAGLALRAARQIEQGASAFWLGWVCVDSTAAVQNIRDRQTHADHRITARIRSRFGIRLT